MNFKPKQKAWVDAATAAGYPAGAIVGYPEIDAVCESMGGVTRPWWMINNPDYRAGRGKFRIPEEAAPASTVPAAAISPIAAPALAAVAPMPVATAPVLEAVTLAKASKV